MPLSGRLQSRLGRWCTPTALAALAVLLALPALWVGRQSDDYWHQLILCRHPACRDLMPSPLLLFSVVDDPARTHRLMDAGWLPWWTYERLRVSFCRPLTALTQWLDYQLWPESAAIMHAHSLAWFALLAYAAAALYRRLLGPTWVAALAGLLFAIDDAHGWPAAWLANRNGLTAAAFGAIAILAHDRWRSQRWRAGAFLAPVLLLLGLLSGEVAVGTFGYLLAHALFLETSSIRARILALAPYAVIGAVWWVVYHSFGFGAFGSSWYTDPTRSPIDFARCVLERAPMLLLGQFGLPPSDICLTLSTTAIRTYWIVATVIVALLVVLFAPLVRRDRVARFWAAGTALSLLPACATVPSDRLLLLTGLGGMGLVAQFIASLARVERDGAIAPTNPTWRRLAWVTAAIFVLVHGIVAPIMLPLRVWSATFFGPAFV
jgi:hypothetical protein